MSDDIELLRRYAEEGAEEAFRELVARHIDLVYAAARRTLGDLHLAQDVAQTVFSDLARKAPEIPRGTVLAGWLYQSARYAATKVVRSEERRRRRETLALESEMNPNEPVPDWESLRPMLDEAMEELPAEDRDAVLLRYFQRRELRAVGDALGISDEAARKRVARALERLRTTLSRRGLTTTATALAATLSVHAAGPAPAGLAATVASISLAGATVGVAGAAVATTTVGTIAFMTKAQVAVVSAALIVAGVTGSSAYLKHRQSALLSAENTALRAEMEAKAPAVAPSPRSVSPALSDSEKEELLRLRGEVSRLRSLVSTNRATVVRPAFSGQPRKLERKVNPNRAPGFVPIEQYAFAGYGTPAEALQSHYWALSHPSSGKLLETLALPPEVRKALPRRLGGTALPTVGTGGAGAAVVATSESAAAAGGLVEVAGDAINVVESQVAVVATLSGGPGAAEGGTHVTEDVMAFEQDGVPLSLHNGHRVVSETEIDANTRELQVEREMADGTTRTETQRMVRVGDEWKVETGGSVRVMTMPGGGSGVLMESGGGAPGAPQFEMRIEQRPAPVKP
jgi:RNA polymerase sigma factor (sigma-70 family)